MATGGADKVVKVWSWRPALGVWGGDMKKRDGVKRGRVGEGRTDKEGRAFNMV